MTSLNINQIVESEHTKCVTMSSREIAQLTGKRHDHVTRDIRKIISNLSQLEDLSPDLGFNIEIVKTGKKGRPE